MERQWKALRRESRGLITPVSEPGAERHRPVAGRGIAQIAREVDLTEIDLGERVQRAYTNASGFSADARTTDEHVGRSRLGRGGSWRQYGARHSGESREVLRAGEPVRFASIHSECNAYPSRCAAA
jgi:hypothetical protein